MKELDPRPARHGWHPGNRGDYMCKCKACGERFAGGKYSWTCADCAYAEPDPTAALQDEVRRLGT